VGFAAASFQRSPAVLRVPGDRIPTEKKARAVDAPRNGMVISPSVDKETFGSVIGSRGPKNVGLQRLFLLFIHLENSGVGVDVVFACTFPGAEPDFRSARSFAATWALNSFIVLSLQPFRPTASETPSTLGRFSASPVSQENDVVPNPARFCSTVPRLHPSQPGLLSVE
jgi:hypothetical protein